jgi:predicted nuclease with TOPRIM domain
VQNAIEILQDAMDLRPPEVDVTHLTDEVERLQAQVTSLEKKNAHLLDEVRQMPDLKGLNDQYDALLKENGDLKAKLDIIKEGLGL